MESLEEDTVVLEVKAKGKETTAILRCHLGHAQGSKVQ